MATMNVSLPDALKAFVEGQVETGRYANASDYVRDLIRRDQERAQKLAAMQALVDEGLASGAPEDYQVGPFLAEMRARTDVAAE
jgi:antitoxin ParD1/3/4